MTSAGNPSLDDLVPDLMIQVAGIHNDFVEAMESMDKQISHLESAYNRATEEFFSEVRRTMTALRVIHNHRHARGNQTLQEMQELTSQLQHMRSIIREFTEQASRLLNFELGHAQNHFNDATSLPLR